MTSKVKDEKRKSSFRKCEDAFSHVEEHMSNFTAFGASYGEDEDEGKKALNVNSVYECQMLLLNVLKKNEELSKENESLKMWKISLMEKIRALEEGKHIFQINLHQSRELMFEQLEENAILISLMKTMEMKSSIDDSLKTDLSEVSNLGGHWPLEIQLLPSRSLFFAQSVQSRGQLTQGQSARRQSTIRDSIAHILEFLLFAQSMQSRGSLAILNCSHRGVFSRGPLAQLLPTRSLIFLHWACCLGGINPQILNYSHLGVLVFGGDSGDSAPLILHFRDASEDIAPSVMLSGTLPSL
ncbi:hypothetical protein LWI28_013462 [Acer negundo]|uniref:Uncharacterized protein n=1 Tax=Acer negundo TaxID=4023 RepID=A0AAD5JKL6_ACENE|nr:hypothetical protein LWI28_013462 [Acer negundo]